jgi:DinB family protein
LTPQEIAPILQASGEAISNLLGSLPPEIASRRPADNEWCINECVGHLIEAEERGFAGRIKTMLDEHEPRLEAWDAADVATARADCERDLGGLLGELMVARRQSVELVRSMKPSDVARGGMHPAVSRITIDEILHEWVHHDANHLRQALAGVQTFMWPAMGATQRFSSG